MSDGLRAAPVTATLHLQFLDYRIDVETNSLRAATRLRNYFRRYLVPPGDARVQRVRVVQGRPSYDAERMPVWDQSTTGRPPKESYYDARGARYILKNRTGLLITLSEGEAAITGDVVRYVNQVVNVVGTLFGLSLIERGYAMLHGAAVVSRDDDGAVVFLGNSGSAKSSVALQLMERGSYDYLSNDRVLVKARRDGVHIVGLPQKPRVNPGTLLASKRLSRLLSARKRPAYEQMDPDELWNAEDKHDVDVGRALGVGERLEGRLARAYSLEWGRSGTGLVIEPVDAAGALAAMRLTAKDFGPFDLRRGEREMEREYQRVARAVPFMRVAGRADPKVLARTLARSD